MPDICLAPMEGVVDELLRDLLTGINDYALCVTEFVRVVDALLPVKVFTRLCPELHTNGQTPAGTLVRVQLLGQSPHWLAENASRAVELGSYGIDLNCGCPSKTVNGNGGGASLLKSPELIYLATRAIRQAVPAELPVTIKVRLGWDSDSRRLEIADAVQQGGATAIVVHGRSKVDGYRAERINWSAIGEIRRRLSIPVIANGEIKCRQSARRCMEITGCGTLMVGRGALCIPNFSRVVKYQESPLPWPQVLLLLSRYMQMDKRGDSGFYHVARIKQWLRYLSQHYPQASILFQMVRALQNRTEIAEVICRQRELATEFNDCSSISFECKVKQ